ncbi:MAG: DUF3500 domain-containing protein [Pirellulaceae bacterium]
MVENRNLQDSSKSSSRLIRPVDRRSFLKASAVAASAGGILTASPSWTFAEPATAKTPETVAKLLFDSLSDVQKKAVCFDWDYQDPKRGLLRTRTANNWQITEPIVNSDFFAADQRQMIKDILEGIIQPGWHEKIHQQLSDDAGGFGEEQAIAMFGKPGDEKFEFVLTGRHMTLRCDGNTTEHVAFGGPIFYGHDPHGEFNEGANHDGNVFWEQALEANKVYQMLDGKQQKQAEVAKTPREQDVAFRGTEGPFMGIPVSELSGDQKNGVQKVLQKLIEPYRQSDQDEIIQCLKTQGGLDKCHLAFFTDNDIGNDNVWDNWRLEGPSFVWHFRGSPHVHVWVNVADNSSVKLNA